MKATQNAQPRRVLFLQDHLEIGGAARAAGRFMRQLEKMGIEVGVAAGDAKTGSASFRITGKPERGFGRIRELLGSPDSISQKRHEKALEALKRTLKTFQPDLVWIHNVHGGFKWGWSLRMVELALEAAPVFWTLHDMWALGDGPSYFPGGELGKRWGHSPLVSLQGVIQRGQCTLLTPSVWLRDLVRSVYPGRCEAWPNPLDVEIFHPGTREKAREELGLKSDEILLLAAAENLADPRKGIDLLREAWRVIRSHKSVRLGLIGRNCPKELKEDPKVREFGPLASEARVAELMSAADLFVHPALVESYGLVLEEAQASGTPVVAFAGGGVEETFQQGATGWIMHERSAQSLQRMLDPLLQHHSKLKEARAACRGHMVHKHGEETFARLWIEYRP